jgi:hypothetical protein
MVQIGTLDPPCDRPVECMGNGLFLSEDRVFGEAEFDHAFR